jgi:adenylylsulfate kinase
MIYWFTGQPGSGKTVLANLLKEKYLPHAYRIDGDEMRELFSNKDYSMKGRISNIDAAQKIAHYLHNQGKDVIVSLVSPYLDQREEFKDLMEWQLQEIFVHYNLAEVRRGREEYHVMDFQKPIFDYLDIDTTLDTQEESIDKILKYVKV